MNTPTSLTCPPWCDGATNPGHWTRFHSGYETGHTKQYGPEVTLHIQEEALDNGGRAYVASAIVITPTPDHCELDGEHVYDTTSARQLARHILAATAFADEQHGSETNAA